MKKENKAFLISALLGCIIFIFIYGVKVLDFSYDDWLFFGLNRKDLVQHYMGWVNYRKSKNHFPIGLIENIIYPDMISVVYTDSIPLFAIIFKLFSPFLGETFQYFGFYGIICVSLLGGWSGKFICHFTENIFYSVISSIFFSASIFLLIRMYWHTALSAHFIIIAALFMWLKKEAYKDIKNAILWSALSLISILTEAYFIPMVWGIMMCSFLSYLIKVKDIKKFIKRFSLTLLFAGASTLLTAYLIGVLYGGVSASDSLLGLVSFNYNGFFNPGEYSKLLKPLPLYNTGQYEGYAFLGIGIYILFIFSIVAFFYRLIKKRERAKKITYYIPFLVFFFGFIIFSGSPVITFGEKSLTLPLPGKILTLWGIFRSTGRLIWPVCYFLMLFIIISFYKYFSSNKKLFYIIFFISLFIQLYDESDYIKLIHDNYTADYDYSPLSGGVWDEIANYYDRIVIYPPTIVVNLTKKADEIMIFASKNDIKINAAYLARNITGKLDERDLSLFETGDYKDMDDTVFIFLAFVEPLDSYDLYYYKIDDDITIGVTKPLNTKGLLRTTYE